MVPFDTNVRKVIRYVRYEHVILVQGPPGCGKSSLANQIEVEAVASKALIEVFNVRKATKEQVENKMDALRKVGARETCLFLVDEAQSLIARGRIDPSSMYATEYDVCNPKHQKNSSVFRFFLRIKFI